MNVIVNGKIKDKILIKIKYELNSKLMMEVIFMEEAEELVLILLV